MPPVSDSSPCPFPPPPPPRSSLKRPSSVFLASASDLPHPPMFPFPPFSASSSKRSSAVPSVAFSTISTGPTPYLRMVSWTCSMGGFLFGYSSSSINDSIPFIVRELDLGPAAVGLVTASFMVGAAIGGIVGGRVADRFGRKRALVLFNAQFIVFTVCTALAPTLATLIPARMLLGFAAGGLTSSTPVLLAEFSTAEYRSQSVSMGLLFIVVGEMCVFIVGAVFGNIWYDIPSIWRWMNLVALLPAIVLLFCHALLVPESPRWLAQSGQVQAAFETLRKMRKTSLQTRNELRDIGMVIYDNPESDGSSEKRPSISTILTVPWIRSILLIGIGISLTQQCYGVVIGMLFGTEVLEEAGLDTRLALIGNIAVGVISFLASWAGLLLVSRVGRRPMLLVGQFGAICMHILIAICSALLPYGPLRGWITLGLLLPFLVFSQGSISTVTWLLTAEIFPLNLRGIGAGTCMLVAWSMACVVAQMFPIGIHYVGQAITFSCFAFIGLLLLVFVWLFLPETLNKTLEELEQQFQAGDWTALKRAGEGRKKDTGGRGPWRSKAMSKVEEAEEEQAPTGGNQKDAKF